MYKCQVLLDSISPNNSRLTTFVCTYPRIIHSEIMTHRSFARNTSSSRAIPINKMIDNIKTNLFIPIWWGKNQSGMQAYEEIEKKDIAISFWKMAFNSQLDWVKSFIDLNLHKQIVNRLLEPWMYITAIITTTNFDNFFALRCHPAAQPEIKKIAEMMKEEYDSSIPKLLNYGEWHLPFIYDEDLDLETKKKVSSARCARVSYLTHTGKKSIEDDLKLFNTLAHSNPAHMSPLEHQATPSVDNIFYGPFFGWKQFRKEFTNENIGPQYNIQQFDEEELLILRNMYLQYESVINLSKEKLQRFKIKLGVK